MNYDRIAVIAPGRAISCRGRQTAGFLVVTTPDTDTSTIVNITTDVGPRKALACSSADFDAWVKEGVITIPEFVPRKVVDVGAPVIKAQVRPSIKGWTWDDADTIRDTKGKAVDAVLSNITDADELRDVLVAERKGTDGGRRAVLAKIERRARVLGIDLDAA